MMKHTSPRVAGSRLDGAVGGGLIGANTDGSKLSWVELDTPHPTRLTPAAVGVAIACGAIYGCAIRRIWVSGGENLMAFDTSSLSTWRMRSGSASTSAGEASMRKLM